MKEILIRLGILMLLLTVIKGLWEQYDYTYLIIKAVSVFFIWTFISYFVSIIFKRIVDSATAEEDIIENSPENI